MTWPKAISTTDLVQIQPSQKLLSKGGGLGTVTNDMSTCPTLYLFRTCCACTCKDYVCKHSQPKWILAQELLSRK